MTTGFEITPDDVLVIFQNHSIDIDDQTIEDIFNEFIKPEMYAIEKVALYGNDLDEQTNIAYKEIVKILKENNLLRNKH